MKAQENLQFPLSGNVRAKQLAQLIKTGVMAHWFKLRQVLNAENLNRVDRFLRTILTIVRLFDFSD